ncbi:MAG: ABC transporter ATP-binding protein [Candidatus Sericytochromatia bacterium]
MTPAIAIRGIGKYYKRYGSPWGRLAEWLTGGRIRRHEATWVLKDISFTVQPGEAVGIMGQNGAGKSTLLKILTGTTAPSAGEVAIHGRVAALLELGMGFSADFTGRQNAYMAGQLLGLSTAEIAALMPEIEAFAEIGEYIDQPLRVYSSGMQMRLAFSVATAVRPDVLIVDEALSVGDSYFQHKSFERIRQFRKQGTTLLIVSHDHLAIQSICDRAILLDKGRLVTEGTPEEVADYYNALLAERQNATVQQKKTEDGRTQTISGTGEAVVEDIALLNEAGQPVELIDVGAKVSLRVRVRVNAPIPRLVLGYMIKDRLGQPMYGTNTHLQQKPLENLQPGELVEYMFTFPANLGPGSYSVATALVSTETHMVDNYEWRDLALLFNVSNLSRSYFAGCTWIEPEIGIKR